jgi:osmotically-inducible protein OsmY
MKFSVFLLLVASCFGCLSRRPEPKTNDYIDDKVTAARVLQLLRSQPDYKYSDVQVAVTNGIVYLSGSVQTPEQRLKITGLAQQAENVHSVKYSLSINHSR